MLTEYEWRRQATYPSRRPKWVGAQCIYPPIWKKTIFYKRKLQRMALVISVAVGLILPMLSDVPMETIDDIVVTEKQNLNVRHVSSIGYCLPEGMEFETNVFTRNQLLQGKMMLLDEAHPLPKDALPPNTASIVKAGSGMIPVRSLDLRAGFQTIEALKALFGALRERNVGGIYVNRGTMSFAQQKQEEINRMRELMRTQEPEAAKQVVRTEIERPGTGELLQEYTVELCITNGTSPLPELRPLEESPQGQALLRLAWRYGWVRSDPKRSNRFRYVGKVHATAMTYLDLALDDYLTLLHQKGILTVTVNGRPQYLILCQPLKGERVAFDLPSGSSFEASLDNMGYAIVACTFSSL